MTLLGHIAGHLNQADSRIPSVVSRLTTWMQIKSLMIPSTLYDNFNQSLATVECSNGSNDLLMRNLTTFSSLSTFPFIRVAEAIAGFNSANCGTCGRLMFNGTTVKVTTIDKAGSGFNSAAAECLRVRALKRKCTSPSCTEKIGCLQSVSYRLSMRRVILLKDSRTIAANRL